MGSSLTRLAQWTSSGSGSRTLAPSPLNETLLSDLVRFLDDLKSVDPQSADVVFEEPLTWSTSLQTSDLQDLTATVSGAQCDSSGRPLLQLRPPHVFVLSLSVVSEILSLSSDKQNELRVCLQENPDVVSQMVGSRFSALLESDGKQIDKVKDQEPKVKLVQLLQKLNQRLMDKVLQQISDSSVRRSPVFLCRQVHLHVSITKNEVESLMIFCGDDERSLLRSLRYTSDFVFANGCRAPPHRQLQGEISYVTIETFDTEPLSATYSRRGVFLNKGVKEFDADEDEYEQISDVVFEDLTSLLKTKSHYFAQNLLKEFSAVPGFGSPVWKKPEPVVKWTSRRSDSRKADRGKQDSKSRANVSVTSLPGRFSPQKSRTPARSRLREVLSESSPESEEEEEEELERRPDSGTDLPSEQLRLQTLIKYLREGDQTATVLTMCSLMELDLRQEMFQLSIRDLGGLKLLLNILDTKEIRCIIGSLKILRVISHNVKIQRSMVKLQGVQSLVPLLDIQLPELQALAAETLANVAKIRKARRTVRHCGGIDKLVRLLDLSPSEELHVEAARCGALALWSCSRSSRNKEWIRKAGGIPLLGRLLRSPHVSTLIPVMGTLQECASEESYRNAIRSEGMIKDLVKNLSSENEELQMHSASAIFKCAEDEKTRDLIHQYRGPQRLTLLLNKAQNKDLLEAATGAVWKCSLSHKNVTRFQELHVLERLVSLMWEQPEEVLVNVVAALGEFAQIPANRGVIGQSGGVEKLVQLLTGRNQALLVNVTRTLGICATDMKNMTIIDQLDGLRLVWSLLKNPSPEVQSSAAWALCPIIHNGKDVSESMRRLIGGFQLLIKLLKSNNNEVLASICAVIAKITEDKEENVALLTDYGAVPLLANLTGTKDERLRRHLADAIANCCMWGQNRAAFGKAGVVPPLVRYVKSNDSGVHQTAAVALYQLSKDVDNCISLHANGVVQPLLELMGHDDEDVAFMAAGCVRNIRMLANANKMARWDK
ncbi:LOW QUALITY PROTEIN: outer dynein arm-docking complex subunit 2 [Boleophthalmus pectinirostris]|uniref:LOW QUALITY PROTEIN: outer dynein arm-docking complex subunit 2 n=1 Tax=Boleophthalmus pectinirostris TaxID=150288 RepID=UPI002432546B|nr:LOW QUALITY PROTEIN: outer dynein arm-docking complex subunit 2 [Boleophthalmus pectinirostris]